MKTKVNTKKKVSTKPKKKPLKQGAVSGSLLKDWQMWEDCILSFLRSHRGLRAKFNEHVDEWNVHTKLPPSAYERGEQ